MHPHLQALTESDSAVATDALQLSISEKGFKRMVELFKHYKDTLHDPTVFEYFQARALNPKSIRQAIIPPLLHTRMFHSARASGQVLDLFAQNSDFFSQDKSSV